MRQDGIGMIKSTFDIGTVAEAVRFWIPGYSKDASVTVGDAVDYRLRCTRNELIEDYDVHVEMGDGTATVTVTADDGRTARVPMPSSDAVTPLPANMVPMAVEGLSIEGVYREYTVCMFSGKRSGMAWMHDGTAYRTIHDAGGYRICLDLVGDPKG